MTTDAYARVIKHYEPHPYLVRKDQIEEFVKQINGYKDYSIHSMDSEKCLIQFCLLHDITIALIIPENYRLFERINRLREQEGKSNMLLLVKQRTKTVEGIDINSTVLNNIHDVRMNKIENTLRLQAKSSTFHL